MAASTRMTSLTALSWPSSFVTTVAESVSHTITDLSAAQLARLFSLIRARPVTGAVWPSSVCSRRARCDHFFSGSGSISQSLTVPAAAAAAAAARR